MKDITDMAEVCHFKHIHEKAPNQTRIADQEWTQLMYLFDKAFSNFYTTPVEQKSLDSWIELTACANIWSGLKVTQTKEFPNIHEMFSRRRVKKGFAEGGGTSHIIHIMAVDVEGRSQDVVSTLAEILT